ncbi:glycosyltransferase family 39 protein [Phormidium sp. CCY1219]|uniref:glycosyltransferase family 39 protein n=1 Tax=Phormidium sp. CCY1219 TaxID=2886104 RepID=UPI002D1F5FBF|nr:glycosyltransferase family 39 protein [Phormidium sp. CCY1219]MEB3828246.1 glycosyltransferase family 39 protein [Phormidium sp. CCY1219]
MTQSQPRFKALGRFSLNVVSIAAIALGIFLRIINLGSREYWYDEALSIVFVSGQRNVYSNPGEVPVNLDSYTALLHIPPGSGLSEMAANLANVLRGITNNQHAPLFYLFHNFWMRLFGNSEIAMRSLVVLMSIAAIASVYGLGRKLLGHRGGLIVAALLATNPFYLAQSLHFRMHGALPFWAALSGWAMLNLTGRKNLSSEVTNRDVSALSPRRSLYAELAWSAILIGSVTAGLLTNYLFSYWALSLAVLSLYLDRRRWFLHGVRLALAGALTVPWILWGVRQQLRNARFVLDQFGANEGESVALRHLQDVLTFFGTQFILGEWTSNLPPASVMVAGAIAIALFLAAIVHLWKVGLRQSFTVALLLSVLPLTLGIIVDSLTTKFTVGWGGGRAVLFILPGFLLLLAVWIERAAGRWRNLAASGLLVFFLTVGILDYTVRDRAMFHQVADAIASQPNTPTLIAMNSRAWGHVLRLAYYVPPTANVDLLARDPADLAPALEKVLNADNSPYSRILWLDAEKSVWSPNATPAQNQQVERLLDEAFCQTLSSCLSSETLQLSGTMELDEFNLQIYSR